MTRHTGLAQIGLPSREAPHIKPQTGQSWWHTGLQHVGGLSTQIGSLIYQCKASLRGFSRQRYKINSRLAHRLANVIKAEGYNYTANEYECYRVTAKIGSLMRQGCKIAGNTVLPYAKRIKVIGMSGNGYFTEVKIIGILKANYYSVYKSIGSLQTQYQRRLPTIGRLKAKHSSFIKMQSVLQLSNSMVHKVSGLMGYGYANIYKVQSVLRQKYANMYRTEGDLANTVGSWFVKITGKINIAAFVSEVPKRIQQFATNKNWFK